MKTISFLKKNGFERIERNSYANKLCNVVISEKGFEVADNDGYCAYSNTLDLYWLIGYLTYNKFLEKQYVS